MRLVEFTKEGLIVRALMVKPLRYKELKRATGLSDAWLSKKLRQLLNLGIIDSRGAKYHVNPQRLNEALKNEKAHIARMIAQNIAELYEDVVAIILFGSLARNQPREADIDLLIVTLESSLEPVQISLEMFRRFGVSADILNITIKELLAWLYEQPPILFGVLSGYQILYDRGYIGPLLETIEHQTEKNWTYIKEKEIWLKKELSPHT